MLSTLLKQTGTIERAYIALASAPTVFIYEFGEIDHDVTYLDSNGQPILVWKTLSTQPCRVEDLQSKEIIDGKNVIITDLLCYMQNTDITEFDRLVVDSITYEIKKVVRARGISNIDHVEAYLIQLDKI